MLKALLLLLMNLALAAMATAQNLVLNGSFEDTVSCELPVIGIRKATHWYTANLATPDVWDADLERECGFPLDPNGFPGWWYITPYEGLRLAGAYYWFGPGSSSTREYMLTRLAVPMVNGGSYEISLRCALSGTYEFAVDHIGVWVGVDSLYEAQPGWLNVTPQLKLRDPGHTYLTETEAWTLLKDTLVAAGGEQWLVVGNFDPPEQVNGISAYPEALNESAYYYIDSVVVRQVLGTTSLDEPNFEAGWSPQGFWAMLTTDARVDELQLVDACGRLVAAERVAWGSGPVQVDLPPLSAGAYIVRLSAAGRWFSRKLIKGEGGL